MRQRQSGTAKPAAAAVPDRLFDPAETEAGDCYACGGSGDKRDGDGHLVVCRNCGGTGKQTIPF